jgi:hypothetical protein
MVLCFSAGYAKFGDGICNDLGGSRGPFTGVSVVDVSGCQDACGTCSALSYDDTPSTGTCYLHYADTATCEAAGGLWCGTDSEWTLGGLDTSTSGTAAYECFVPAGSCRTFWHGIRVVVTCLLSVSV